MNSSHISDERLVQLLDGELTPRDTLAARQHVDACAVCARRHLELAESTAAFHAIVDAAPVGGTSWRPPAAVRRTRRYGFAAAIAAALLAAVLVPAARAAIGSGVRQLMAVLRSDATTSPPQPSSMTAGHGMILRFDVRGDSLDIALANSQRAGWIIVERGSVDIAELWGSQPGTHDVSAVPGALLIGNDSASTASYRVRVPRRIRAVNVAVERVPRGRLDAAADSLRVALDRAAGS